MKKIRAYFGSDMSFVYTTAILHLLKTDPQVTLIIDDDTGEIIYEREV